MPFTNSVRDLRKQNGLTQDQLAERANLSRLTVNYIERGTVDPTAETMYKIAAALNVRVDDVFHYVENKPLTTVDRLIAAAKSTSSTLALAVALIVVFFIGGTGITLFNADRAMASGNYTDATMLDFTADSLLHPFTTRARFDAIKAAMPLRIGIGRGYMTPVPSRVGCSAWLNKYEQLVDDTDFNDVTGRWLHEDAADCLDRVGATEAAFHERQAIIQHPGYILARTEALDFYLYTHAAMESHLMGDEPAAKRLLTIARDDHPAYFKRWFGRNTWHPTELRLLRPVAKEIQ